MAYAIYGRKKNGETVYLFLWTRIKADGIARAWKDAREHGIELTEVWAKEVKW